MVPVARRGRGISRRQNGIREKRSDKVSSLHREHGKRRIPDPKDPSGCGCLTVLLRAPQN